MELSEDELLRVAHREYTTAYAFGENSETVNYTDSQSKGDYKYIADVLGYENGFAKLEMRNRFIQGDELEILSPDDNSGERFIADEIYLKNGEKVTDAKLVQAEYLVKCPYEIKRGDYIRKKQ